MALRSEDIKRYWNDVVRQTRAPQKLTQRDIYQSELEINKISAFLLPEDRVLDVGCGNGYATRIYAQKVREILGIDFCEGMISKARTAPAPSANTFFRLQDILTSTSHELGTFDKIISQRCLINLTSWEDQQKALINIHSLLVDGGTYIMCEGSYDGRKNLNQCRRALNLTEMPKVWYNLDFVEERTKKFLTDYFIIEKQIGLGLYDLITRVVHPLLVAPEKPEYETKINEIAKEVSILHQGMESLSRALILVLKKQ